MIDMPSRRPTRRMVLTGSAGVAAAVAAGSSAGIVLSSATPAQAQTGTSLSAPVYLTANGVTVEAVIAPSNDASGQADSTVISGLLSQTGFVSLQLLPGTYFIAQPVTVGPNQSFYGSGLATSIQPGSDFPADNPLITVTGAYASLGRFSLLGNFPPNPVPPAPVGSTNSNPIVSAGIRLTNASNYLAVCTIEDIYFQAVNGWCVRLDDSGSYGAPVDNIYRGLRGYGNGGIYLSGASRTQQFRIEDCVLNCDIGGTTGSPAYKDSVLIENVYDGDIIGSYGGGHSSGSAGNGLHFTGNCAAIRVVGGEFSCEGAPSSPAQLPAGVLSPSALVIDGGTSLSNCCSQLDFTGTLFQTAYNGALIGDFQDANSPGTAASPDCCHDITFVSCAFQSNLNNGAVINTAGRNIRMSACVFGSAQSNGRDADPGSPLGGACYDLYVGQASTSGPTGQVAGCNFASAATGTPRVTASIGEAAADSKIQILDPQFSGTGSAAGNQLQSVRGSSALPVVYRMPIACGRATLKSGSIKVREPQVAATSVIRLAVTEAGGTPGALFVSQMSPGEHFIIRSTSSSDVSVVQWTLESGG